MSRLYFHVQSCAFLLGFILFLSSCSEITLPRLSWGDEKKDPSVPLRVRLELDSSVQQAAFPYHDACGNEKIFQIGNQLSQMLLEDSQKVFQQVVPPQDPTFEQFADGILQYTVLERNYELAIPRLESDAEYPAKAMLRIRTSLHDISTGKEVYAETFESQGDWKVSTDEGGKDCELIGIGIPINEAVDEISDQLVDRLRDSGRLQIAAQGLVTQRQQVTGGVSQSPGPNPVASTPLPVAQSAPPLSTSPRSVEQAPVPSVQFRTKLVDANRNLVLESGEALKLLFEIHNVSDSIIPSAYVELRGTPALVEAFKRVVSIPVPLGLLKAGEKRTAEIRGRVPRTTKNIKGELIVGIILSEGTPPGTHTILAEITPGLPLNKRKQ